MSRSRRQKSSIAAIAGLGAALFAGAVRADVGDPQIRTDHPWYPGELAISTFPRLFRTQAEAYARVTGAEPKTDEERALAAWLWRNTHYWHGEEGTEDLWGKGFTAGQDLRTREYWTGLFAHGFGLCGTTHSQWVAEMNALLGPGRGRGVGVEGHNSFEAWVTGGAYGTGRWVLLDHDISTVIFDPEGKRLLSLAEVQKDWKRLTDQAFKPEKQRGWPVCGLAKGDGGVYAAYNTAEYLAGYSGVPPMVHLRRGETLRRYLQPGLEDGKTFVFWGRNYNTGGIPGPERSQTWVNQPEKLYGSRISVQYREGQARFANAVYTYRPDFASGDYREGVVDESPGHVTLEFRTPYIIGATPANRGPWGVYEPGCRNGMTVTGRAGVPISVSVDRGQTWKGQRPLSGTVDFTDLVRGHRQYWLRLGAGPEKLRGEQMTIRTVCQVNSSVLPRLKDDGSRVNYEASGRAVVSAGPNLPQAQAHVVDGAFGTPRVTLKIDTPRGEKAVTLFAAAHVNSGNPPDPSLKYQIEYSADGGKTWLPVVKDWTIGRQGEEPKDFWSQSMCWGTVELPDRDESPLKSVLVRFHNNGGRAYARAEAHLAYATRRKDGTKVTFDWTEDAGARQDSFVFRPGGPTAWEVKTGKNVKTRWVEFQTVAEGAR